MRREKQTKPVRDSSANRDLQRPPKPAPPQFERKKGPDFSDPPRAGICSSFGEFQACRELFRGDNWLWGEEPPKFRFVAKWGDDKKMGVFGYFGDFGGSAKL